MLNEDNKSVIKIQNLEKELALVRNALEESQQLNNNNFDVINDSYQRSSAFIIKHAPIAVMITNQNGLIEFVNPKFEEVSGYKTHEVVGKSPSLLHAGEINQKASKDLWETLKQGKQWTGIFHNQRKDGEQFWERAVISGIKNNQGIITQYIAIKEDITEIKKAREKLEQERLKIIQQSKMAEIGLLTSGILHEIGNPIAAMRGLICELKDSCQTITNLATLKQEMHGPLNLILTEIDRVTGITIDMSEFAYSYYTKVELLDINSIIKTTCRLVQYDKRWTDINLQINLDPNLPAVPAIKDQITQVLINLLSNAAYAVRQEIEIDSKIEVSCHYDEKNINIIIKDNGCGIKDEHLPKIYDYFVTSKAPGEGTGLGLAMCKSIIDSHQGKIETFSEVGSGTQVHVSLPINPRQEA